MSNVATDAPAEKPVDEARRRGLLGRLARLRRDESGATAVEFAIIATPFIALIAAIIETSLTFLAGQMLDTATNDAARLIRTGQAQAQSLDSTKFKNEICKRLYGLVDCAGISIDARVLTSFSGFSSGNPSPFDGSGNFDASKLSFNPGGANDIVVVRAYYQFPIVVNKLIPSLANLPNGKRLLTGVAAFRNEPFPW